MNDAQIVALIKDALHDVVPTRTAEFENVSLTTSIEDLQLDSIAAMEMVSFLEDKVSTTFPDEEIAKVNCLGDLASLVRAGRVGVMA